MSNIKVRLGVDRWQVNIDRRAIEEMWIMAKLKTGSASIDISYLEITRASIYR